MLADRGTMAIVLVEQFCDFAEALADRCVVTERGEVIASGPGSAVHAKGARQLVAMLTAPSPSGHGLSSIPANAHGGQAGQEQAEIFRFVAGGLRRAIGISAGKKFCCT